MQLYRELSTKLQMIRAITRYSLERTPSVMIPGRWGPNIILAADGGGGDRSWVGVPSGAFLVVGFSQVVVSINVGADGNSHLLTPVGSGRVGSKFSAPSCLSFSGTYVWYP